MPHVHEGEGPNSGWLHPLSQGGGDSPVGQIEVKLHDDAGDVEVWLTRGQSGGEPLDVPLATVVTIEFPDLEGRAIELRVRNTEANEGEDGVSNIRNGMTNYFIFPGESGTDASWLMGKEFAAKAVVTFQVEGSGYQAGPFELKPHVH